MFWLLDTLLYVTYRLNHCFIEWLCLLAQDGERLMEFDANFCVWIKALQQMGADVHVEVVDPCYKMGMEAAYRQLHGAFNMRIRHLIREHRHGIRRRRRRQQSDQQAY